MNRISLLFPLLVWNFLVAFCKVAIESSIHCNAAVNQSNKVAKSFDGVQSIFNLILCYYYSITLYLMCSNKRSTLFMAGKNCDGDKKKRADRKTAVIRSHEIVEIDRCGISNIQLWRSDGETTKSTKCSLN